MMMNRGNDYEDRLGYRTKYRTLQFGAFLIKTPLTELENKELHM